MKDGTVKMNPGANNPDIVETVGPTDPDIAALFVETVDGEPIAVLANYALHYVGAPGHMISADYFGLFAEEIQKDGRRRNSSQCSPTVVPATSITSMSITR